MEKRWAGAIKDIIGDGLTAQYHFRVQGRSMAPSLLPGDEVTVESCSLEALHPGDLILLQNGHQPFLHRFLGVRHRDGQRWLLAGGDRKRRLDPLWPEGALWGRATAIRRGEQSRPLPSGRRYAWRLRLRTALWAAAYRLRVVLPLVLPLLLLPIRSGRASVTLVSFDAEWAGDQARLTWETASEVDSIGFYVLRSDQEGGEYQRVTELIPSEGDLVGAAYQWIDESTFPGQVYYYKLEDVSASGGSTLAGPVSPPAVATATFTPTPEPTATDTPPPSSTPTSTPTPLPSPTPTTPPTHTPLPSPIPSATPTPPPTATPTATPTVPPTATSTAPATHTPMPTAEPSLAASQVPPQTTATNTPMPSPELSLTSGPAYGTPLPQSTAFGNPSPTPQPSPVLAPTATEVAMVIVPQSEGESEAARLPASAAPPDTVDEEELARAKRRLTWSLIGIGGAIGGVLLLILLALMVFALYQWGFLRSG